MNRLLPTLLWPFRTVAAILLQPDKVSHFYWGCAMGLTGLWMGWYGLAVVAAFAAAKELYDAFHPPHQCEAWDFLATLIGGACAIGIIVLHGRFP